MSDPLAAVVSRGFTAHLLAQVGLLLILIGGRGRGMLLVKSLRVQIILG
jgi:hypothetical protein